MTSTGLSRTAAPPPHSSAQVGRTVRRLHLLLRPFWVVPALWVAFALTLGLSIPSADNSWLTDHLPFLFPGDLQGARSLLSTIAGAMISVTGLVFSNTMVVLQLSSSQFSPRVLQTFLSDRITQHTLGVFTATFVYALTVLRSLGAESTGTEVPQVAVTLSYLFVLAAVGMFLAFIAHITRSVGVTNIVLTATRETRELIERGDRRRAELPTEAPDLPDLGRQVVVTAARSGYLDGVDLDRLRTSACRHDVRIELLHPLGTFVPEGSPLGLVHGGAQHGDVDWNHEVGCGVHLNEERSIDQDPSFGFRRLVDIAERALSPGTNDPTTAIQVVDQLHDLLRRLAGREDPFPVLLDDDGAARLVTRELTFADYLDLALDEIAHWGADSIQVPRRLSSLLADLEAAATPAHVDAVRAKRAEINLS